MYWDPPYPSKEKHYLGNFSDEDHLDLIEILIECPFYWMLSIGASCELYLDALSDFYIVELKTKYQTDANSQDEVIEFLVMNYNPEELGKSIPRMLDFDGSTNTTQKSLSNFLEVD